MLHFWLLPNSCYDVLTGIRCRTWSQAACMVTGGASHLGPSETMLRPSFDHQTHLSNWQMTPPWMRTKVTTCPP